MIFIATGRHVVVECNMGFDPPKCWCVHGDSGKRIPGSEVRGHDARKQINCDQYRGSFQTRQITLCRKEEREERNRFR